MDRKRETWQTDVGVMIAGLITPAIGYLITQNRIDYLPGDPRGEPWYAQTVLVGSMVLGAFVFLVGLIRFLQWLRDRSG